jgi:hypothetical protein
VGAGAFAGTLVAVTLMAGGCGEFAPAVGALRNGQTDAAAPPAQGDGGGADGGRPDSAPPIADDSGGGSSGGYPEPGYPP